MKKYHKAVTFSYDDGVCQDRRLVEIFNRYGLKATFNLNTGIQNMDNMFTVKDKVIHRMEQEDIGGLYQGHEIAVHGLTHASLFGMSSEDLDKELGEDMENIARIYGRRPVGMAYAYGDSTKVAADWLRNHGVRYARMVEVTHDFSLPEDPIHFCMTCHHNDGRLFGLADQFLDGVPKAGEQWLFSVWGHSYEFDVNGNWARIETICQMVSGREDIFYGTNRECLEMFGCI